MNGSRYSGKKFKRSKLPWRKNVFKLFFFVLALSTVQALRLIDSISFAGKMAMERSLNSIKSRVKITIIALDKPATDSRRNRQRNLS